MTRSANIAATFIALAMVLAAVGGMVASGAVAQLTARLSVLVR